MFDSSKTKTTWAAKVKESQDQLAASAPEALGYLRKVRSWFSPRVRRSLKAARASDWGRTYGWFVERNQIRIGELDYVRWDSDSQFWHEYHSKNIGNEILPSDPDEWIEQNLTLRNRRFPDVVITVFLTSFRTFQTDGIIRVRFASVPEERFEKEDP